MNEIKYKHIVLDEQLSNIRLSLGYIDAIHF